MAFFRTSTDSSKFAELEIKDQKNAIMYALVTVTRSVSCHFASKRDDLGQTPALVYDSAARRSLLHHMMILCTRVVLDPTVFHASLRSIQSPSAYVGQDELHWSSCRT
jgi:hypothetical protein